MTSDPRNRVVFFRLTQNEYSKLKEASSRNGARNLSDFMRTELLAFIHSGTLNEHLQRQFQSIEQRIVDLQLTTVSLFQGHSNNGQNT
jgi:hypothetical protein